MSKGTGRLPLTINQTKQNKTKQNKTEKKIPNIYASR